jgi:tetratricopeptide (TPR) repeat protein
MTVGLPGAGIGGLFYLISALAMPFHAVARRIGARSRLTKGEADRAIPWALIARQVAIAAGILVALWLTGWILARLLVANPAVLGRAQSTAAGQELPNVLRIAAVIVSLVTLGAVLVAVQIARLVIRSNRGSLKRAAEPVSKIAATLLFVMIVPRAAAQSNDSAAIRHLAAADSAFDAEDTATARHEYEAALEANPGATRAMYRLGQLAKRTPQKAESYFRMYVRNEPNDAWGWIALGNILSQQKKFGGAMEAFDRAQAIAPDAAEVAQGRARIAGAKARTAPSVEIFSGGSRDSEENGSARVGGALNIPLSDRASVRFSGGKRWLSGFFDATVTEGSVGILARPIPTFRIEATGGVARPHSTVSVTDTIPAETPTPVEPGNGNGSGNGRGRGRSGSGGTPPVGTIIQTESVSAANLFVGSVRGVARKSGTRSLIDLRATRMLLDATPVLAANRVVRSEIAGRGDLEIVRRVKLRGAARAGRYAATGDENTRTALLGGLALNATDAIEVSGVFQRLAFSHATTSGYFAPQIAQLAEAATYSEFEWPSGLLLVIDAGAGAQRIQEFGAAMGGWEPSYRAFASLDVPFRPASAIHLELDTYDSRIGSDAPSLSSSWRSFSFSASLRLALR